MSSLLLILHFYFKNVKVYKSGIITYALINGFEIGDQMSSYKFCSPRAVSFYLDTDNIDRFISISTMGTLILRIYG